MAQSHHYLFDTVGTYNDATGSSNFTNVYGSINSSGLINQCYQIAGYNLMDMVNAYTSANILPTSGAFSVAFWIKSWGSATSSDCTAFQLGSTGIFFKGYAILAEFAVGQNMPTFETKSVRSAFNSTTWTHLAFVYSGTTWTIYLNGSVPTQYGTNFTPNSATYNASTRFEITGNVSGGGYYIDDLRVYDAAIDSTEVTFLYNGGSGTQANSGGGGGGSATQLSVTTQPTRSYSTKNITTQPVINLLTSGGSVDGSATNTVFANVVSGAGTIGGSTSVSATSGVATFSGLSVTGFGPIGLGFTASGLTAAYSTAFIADPIIPIMPQRTETSGYVPVSGDLRVGELFINIPDQKGYVKKVNGTIASVWQPSTLTSGSIGSGLIANNAVVSGSIASGQIGFNHLSSGTATANLLSGSVSNNQLANNKITINGASTVLGGSYTNAALTIGTGLTGGSYNGSGAVTIALASGAAVTNLLSGSIGSGLLANNSVVSGSIASGQIGVNHLVSGLITTLTLGSGQVTSGNIASGVVFRLLSGNITSGFIANNAVVSGSIASGQVGTNHLANNAVASGNIASGQVGTYALAATAPTSGNVLQLNGTSMQWNALPTSTITSGSITSGMIGNNAVLSGNIGSGQITNNHIASGSLLNTAFRSGQVLTAYNSTVSGTTGIVPVFTDYNILGDSNITTSSGRCNVSGNITINYAHVAAISGTLQYAITVTSGGQAQLGTISIHDYNKPTNLSVGDNTLQFGYAGPFHNNTVIGRTNLYKAGIASGNIIIGNFNAQLSTSPTDNIMIGNGLGDLNNGGKNIIIGNKAGTYYSVGNSNGSGNIIIGYNAGNSALPYSDNIVIGVDSFVPNSTVNSIVIGNLSSGLGSGSLVIGNEKILSGKIFGCHTVNGLSWTSGSITSGGLLTAVLNSGTVPIFGVASGAIFAANMASGSVISGSIASGQIGQFHLANNSVFSGAIASGQVGQFKLSSGAVNSGHIGNAAVVSGSVASGQVGQFHLSDNSIFSGAIASGQIGNFHLSSGAVTSGDIGNNAVVSGSVASGQIGQFHLSDNSVFSGAIASGQISNFKLSSGSVLSGHVGNNAVVSGSIASGQIGQFHLSSGCVNSGHVGNGSVVSGSIASGQIGPSHFNQIIANNIQPKTNNFRLSVQSGVAITSTDQSAQSTLYLVPYTGNQIALYDGTNWKTSVASGAVVSLAITGLTSGLPYDVFAYDNSGVPALEFGAVWSTVNTRADAIQIVDGVALKSGTTTRRLVGTILPTAPTTTNDTANQRYVNNYDNQVSRQLFKTDATNHTYNSTSPQIWNLSSGNQIQYVASRAGIGANVSIMTASRVSTGGGYARTQIVGGTNQLPSTSLGMATLSLSGAILQYLSAPSVTATSVLGYNYFYGQESVTAAGATGTFSAIDLFGEMKG